MRLRNFLIIGAGVFLASCSASYRSAQTVDDVYYSPSTESGDGYVSVNNGDDESYNYGEDYQIRRGIRNPLYRSSFSFNLGLGYGSPFFYDPFSPYGYYGSMFNPYLGYGLYSPFSSFSMFYSPFNSFYYPFYGSFGGYYPYYYGGGYGYPYYGGHGVYYGGTIVNNGPRVTNLGAYGNTGLRTTTGETGVRSINQAPVRTLSSEPRKNSFIRRIFTPNEGRTINPSNDNSGSYAPARNQRRFSPNTNQNQRIYTPSNRSNDNFRPSTPTRTFESSPSRSFEPSRSTAPSRSGSNGGGAPVRRF